MKTTHTFDFPLRWAAPGLVTGLLLLSGVAAANDQKFPATGQTCKSTYDLCLYIEQVVHGFWGCRIALGNGNQNDGFRYAPPVPHGLK